MLYFSTGPKDACWDSRESGILENLGSGITSFYTSILFYNKKNKKSCTKKIRLVCNLSLNFSPVLDAENR